MDARRVPAVIFRISSRILAIGGRPLPILLFQLQYNRILYDARLGQSPASRSPGPNANRSKGQTAKPRTHDPEPAGGAGDYDAHQHKQLVT
jgi:hypothetical protein